LATYTNKQNKRNRTMKPKKVGAFEIDVFKHGVEVYVGDLPDECSKTARAYCTLFIDERLVKIYLLSKDEYEFYIMHECIHAADFILNNIGANLDTKPDDSEVRAYLAEYIYCKVGCILGKIKLDKKINIHKGKEGRCMKNSRES